jgi:nickel/cobalt transporter (NicO) family protein
MIGGTRGSARRRTIRRAVAAVLGALAVAILPAAVLAHPLGNFTINHYAGIRVGPDRIAIDLVIDEAEIPTFQERQRIDLDGDGAISSVELETERVAACPRLLPDLHLAIAGRSVSLQPVEAGLSFLPGAGGLTTMRVVCEMAATLAAPMAAGSTVSFEDDAFSERIGWREVTVLGDGMQISGTGLLTASVSDRLTHYPTDLLSQPLATRSVAFSVTPGGPAIGPWQAPDAATLPGSSGPDIAPGEGASGVAGAAVVGAIPGGVGTELSAIVDGGDLSPALLLGSLLVAIGLGAAHALSPGHGKTIMAAYLVGTRGTTRQAIGLGLAVTVSHTLGVLVLAMITLAAASTLPPERLYPILGLSSGGLVVAIGGSLLVRRLRVLLAARQRGHGRGEGGVEHDHQLDDHHAAKHAHPHDHGHGHGHGHAPGQAHGHSHAIVGGPGPDGTTAAGSVSWRSLIALGLSGGLVPSASALILLLGSIAAGRVAYGVILVVAFGIGMALVLGGVGIALVHASKLAGRLPGAELLARRWDLLQLATAVLVVALGVVLTSQALTQVL